MIKLINIEKDFNNKTRNTKALNNINIEFPSTGMFFLTGKSGSGKTTLLNIIALLQKPTNGDIIFDNVNYKDIKDIDLMRKNYFGMIFQDNNIFNDLTVYENMLLSMKINNNLDYNKIDELLTDFGILDLKNEKVNFLSGGERQRIAIVRALLKGSKVILADEPTAALDRENNKLVFEALQRASKDVLVIISTHDIDSAEKYSDGIVHLSYGEIESNTVINNIVSDYKLSLTKSKTTFNTINYISTHILTRQKFRIIFTLLFYVISLVLMVLSLDFMTFDSSGFMYKNLTESGENYGFVTYSETTNIEDGEIDFSSINKNDYPSLDFKTLYYTDGIKIDIFTSVNQESLDRFKYDKNVFNNVIINNVLNDYEIIPTDYNIDALIANGKLNCESYISSKMTQITLNLHTLRIVDYTVTDYKKSNDILQVANYYKNIQMNYDTYLELYGTDLESISGYVNDYNSKIFDTRSRVGWGNHPVSENEIVLSTKLIFDMDTSYFDQFLLNPDNLLGEKITLKISSSTRTIEEREYTICGFLLSNDYGILCYDKIYNYLTEDNKDYIYADDPEFLYVTLGTKDDSKRFFDTLDKLSLTFWTSNCLNLYIISYENLTVKSVYRIIFYSSLALIGIVSLFFALNVVKNNKKNIGILSSMGMNKYHISLTFIIDVLKIYILSVILSNIIYALFLYTENEYNKKSLEVKINTYSYDFIACIVVYSVTIIFIVLTLLFSLLKLRKKDIKDIIYD